MKPPAAANEFATFLDTFVAELIAMSDEQVLENTNAAEVRAHGMKLLAAAKKAAGPEDAFPIRAASPRVMRPQDKETGHE